MLLRDGEQVLLGLRQGTGYADGEWATMPSGHLEEGESVIDAGIREALEELGIIVDRLEVVHVMHHRNPGGTARIGFFLLAAEWRGTPVNLEPDKCANIAWFPVTELPVDTNPYARAGIAAAFGGETFSLHGWERPTLEELQREAARAGYHELTVAILAADGGELVVAGRALPATGVRPGESIGAAVARLHPGEPKFVDADDYVSAGGVRGRRFVFAVTPPPGRVPDGLPERDRRRAERWVTSPESTGW